ncbi:MAG: glycosyltransferase family 39 protein [Kiritimatiellae bacterium]|nr:glycosyltransferase family 39 protein [Kiritimatiellia bacterium]
MARPFESRIQDIVYNVDVGVGLRLVKLGLYLLMLLAIVLLYTATQFHGLKDAEAMDLAQLGRNLMQQGRFTTQQIRPASMWYLIEHSKSHDPQLRQHPDIVHPPIYPLLLAGGFKLFESAFASVQPARIFPPEQWVVVPLGHLFSVLTGLLIFFVARMLFDGRVALLGITLFFLTNDVWAASISGTPIPVATFWVMAAWCSALMAGNRFQRGAGAASWAVATALAGLFCGLAFLTSYGTVALAPAIALLLAVSIRPHAGKVLLLFFAVLALVAAPWVIRNAMVSGGWFGLAPYLALNGANPVTDNLFERTLAQDLTLSGVLSVLRPKLMLGLNELYSSRLTTLGGAVLMGVFFTTYFYSFARENVRRLRWCVLAGLLLVLPVAALYGEPAYRLLHVFLPFALLYAVAFFYILLDRMQLRIPLLRMGVIGAFGALVAMPLFLALLPPRVGAPYPPYYPPYIVHVSRMLESEELMCTDMPWATAWYGNRTSLLLPATLDEFYEINDVMRRVSGIYFTTLTRDREYVRTLLTGSLRTWFPILEGRIPSDFPLTKGFPLNNLDQLFLTDRVRWEAGFGAGR